MEVTPAEIGRSRRMARKVYARRHGKESLKHDYVIHHIDRNPFNNSISNLQQLSRSEHGVLHGSDPHKRIAKPSEIVDSSGYHNFKKVGVFIHDLPYRATTEVLPSGEEVIWFDI